MTARAGATVLAALAAGALAGCGSEPLSREDSHTVAVALGDISFYCPHDRAPQRPAPPHIARGVERLIEIHRDDPDKLYLEGSEEEAPMSEVLEGTERQLRWCDPRIADRVEREL